MKTNDVSLMAVLAGLYVIIGLLIPSISFGAIQCRLSDALYPLIAFLGLPAVIGLTLGQLIYNIYGFSTGFAIGWLDLFSPIVFIIFKLLIMKFGYKAVPIHVIAVGVWVGFLLQISFGLPMLVTIPSIIIGEFIAEIIVGIPLAEAVKRRTK